MATKTQNATRWEAYNPLTRKYEVIDLDDAEILPGQSVMKVYYCRNIEKYVTIPGDCIYRMNANYELVLES